MKQEYQDQIDKYVLGQMDDTGKATFEQEAAQNAELQEQLQFTMDVASATKEGLLQQIIVRQVADMMHVPLLPWKRLTQSLVR